MSQINLVDSTILPPLAYKDNEEKGTKGRPIFGQKTNGEYKDWAYYQAQF